VVLPVNFVLNDGAILFRTAADTKLHQAAHGSVVAFEVDGFDKKRHLSWSVMVQGIASEIVDPVEIRRARRIQLKRWGLGKTQDRFVRIDLTQVSGRQVPTGD